MSERTRLSLSELQAEAATALPAKEVLSLLDLNADIDLALDLAAPVDLAVAANLNVALPIDAAVSANVLSDGATATAGAPQQVLIEQTQSGEAVATAPQTATVDQEGSDAGTTGSDGTTTDGTTGTTTGTTDGSTGGTTTTLPATGDSLDTSQLLSGGLLQVDVKVDADLDLAAPIAGAIAANGNIAAPIDAAVSANIASDGSTATALASQTAVIRQSLEGVTAAASATQTATITQ